MNDTTLGFITAAVPLIVIGFFALRRLPWIFAFFVALVAVGIGYLDTTGAIKDLGHKVRVALPAGILPEHKKAGEADGGAMKALPQAAEPAAPTPPPAPAPEATPATPPASPAPAAESTPPPAAPAPEAAPATPPAAEPAPAAPAPESTPPAAPSPAPANP